MGSPWPLFDLILLTPRLVLRPPTDEDLFGLLDAIDAGIHPPEEMPFAMPWTDDDPAVRRTRSLQHWWSTRASFRPEDWVLHFAAFVDGRPVGVQGVHAKDFLVLREVHSGSWLSMPYQGQGYGKEMRAAVLHFAFLGLGAEYARTGAFVDNPSSLGVTRALGYRENGRHRLAPRGAPKEMIEFELSRDDFLARGDSRPAVEMHGLEAVLPMFGLPAAGPVGGTA